jgi:hypothetical protein
MLEDRLRELFAARAEPVPATDDAAGRAIRHARRVRQRQTAGASVSAAVLVLVVAGVGALGVLQTGEERRASPVSPFDVTAEATDPSRPTTPPVVTSAHPRGSGLDLDLQIGNQLWTADGKRLALTGVGEVTRIYRVPVGWIYGGDAQVRLMRPDGTSTALIGTADRWIVSPDGGRIAAVIGQALHVGRIGESGMVAQATATVPAGTEPVVFAGGRVVLAGPSSSGYDVLDPARPTAPAWNRDVLAVFGRHGSGLAGLVRRAGAGHPCLAVLKLAPGLPLARAGTCAVDVADATQAWLSPNGAWLAATDGGGLSMIDVARVASGHPGTTRCEVRSTVTPAWDGSTLVTADERGLVRCRTNGRQDLVAPPAGIAAGWHLVPALTAAPAAPATTQSGPSRAA